MLSFLIKNATKFNTSTDKKQKCCFSLLSKKMFVVYLYVRQEVTGTCRNERELQNLISRATVKAIESTDFGL